MANLNQHTADESLRQAARDERIAAVSRFEGDIAYDELGLRYDRLRIELAKISARLIGVENELPPRSTNSQRVLVQAAGEAELVRAMIAARRRRSRFFPSEIFADPAWDILLDLYLAELEQRRTMVSSLCVAAEVPATTALRWITALVDRGMLVRRSDPLDRRRVYIELTAKASEGMRCYFDGSETPARQPAT